MRSLEAVNQEDRPIVYMLWGRPAPEQDSDADESKASDPEGTASESTCLRTADSSDASHFSQTNAFLESKWSDAD